MLNRVVKNTYYLPDDVFPRSFLIALSGQVGVSPDFHYGRVSLAHQANYNGQLRIHFLVDRIFFKKPTIKSASY
jgi:hypothetical protein